MEDILYPLYLPTTNAGWIGLEKSANLLLGFPNGEKETYSQKMVDANGSIYFLVNEETASLVDLNSCLKFEDIQWPKMF
jgi:hypothetical protein